MAKYKVVPVEITDEMAEASGREGCFGKSVHDQAQDMWTAMLAAAPDVQGEPVEPTDDELIAWAGEEQFFLFCDKDDFLDIARSVLQRYAAPQPAPDSSALAEALEQVIKADIKLPPLPKGDIAADTCPLMWVHTDQQTENYAREAIKADRQQRGEQQWQPIGACPIHVDVLFYREDAGVFSGKFTDAYSFMTDKERDEWVGTEEEMLDLGAWSYEPEGVYRMDGDLVPTHWMPLPAPPATQGAQP